MPAWLTFSDIDLPPLDSQSLAELQALAAEAMGWQPLGEGLYLHHNAKGNPQDDQVLHVVGLPDIVLTGLNVLLLT